MTGCDSLVAADDDFVVHDRINLHQQVFGNAKYRPKIFIGLSQQDALAHDEPSADARSSKFIEDQSRRHSLPVQTESFGALNRRDISDAAGLG